MREHHRPRNEQLAVGGVHGRGVTDQRRVEGHGGVVLDDHGRAQQVIEQAVHLVGDDQHGEDELGEHRERGDEHDERNHGARARRARE